MKLDGIIEYIGIAVFIVLATLAGGGLDTKQDASVKKAVLLSDDEPAAEQQAHANPEADANQHAKADGHAKKPAAKEKKPAPAVKQLTLELDAENSGVDATGFSKWGKQNVIFNPSEGSFSFPEGDFTKGKINGTIDMTFLIHTSDTLVHHIQEESFFHTTEYPESTFESTEIKKTDDGYEIQGYLTIKGIKKKIGLPSQIEETDESITISSETGIGISWWELDYKGAIKEDVTLNIELIFTKG